MDASFRWVSGSRAKCPAACIFSGDIMDHQYNFLVNELSAHRKRIVGLELDNVRLRHAVCNSIYLADELLSKLDQFAVECNDLREIKHLLEGARDG